MTFPIGGELTVRRLGFGAMHLPTEPGPAREAAIAVARRAVELGVTLIDTAYLYGGGANEELLVEALYPYPPDLLITTKVGVAPPSGTRGWELCGRPEFLREQVEQALRRLRVDRLELLQLHRVDPEVPLADQVGALGDLQRAGKIGHIGLSEVTAAELAEAREIIDVASVQNRYNILDREHDPVLDACESAGIAFLPWRPVHPAIAAAAAGSPGRPADGSGASAEGSGASAGGSGVSAEGSGVSAEGSGVSAAGGSGVSAEGAGLFADGEGAAAVILAVAREVGATAAQVSLAWLLARSPVMLPIPGTANLHHLAENVGAATLHLTGDQRRRLDQIRP